MQWLFLSFNQTSLSEVLFFFFLTPCLNCCCPEVLCLSDFLSVLPAAYECDSSLGGWKYFSLSCSLSHTPLFSPTFAGFQSKHRSYFPQWDDSPTPRHTPPIFPHLLLLAPSFRPLSPHPQQPVVWPQSVWFNIEIPFKLRRDTLQ